MEHLRAVFVIFCVRFAGLACATPPRAVDRSFIPRVSQIQASDEEIANQPRRLERGSADEQPLSLLSVVRSLHQRPIAAVATAVRAEGAASGQTSHERTLLSDMGHLEDELESWKQAEYNMQKQVQVQAATLEAMKAEQAKAFHDEQIAEMVWWDCKMLLLALAVLGIAFCVCLANWQKPWSKYNGGAAAIAREAEQNQPPASARKEAPPPLSARCAPQPEFVEQGQEAEDVLQVTLPPSLPKPAENTDLEADWFSAGAPVEEEEVAAPGEPAPAPKQCEYFSMDDVEPATNRATAEETWWAESASAY